MSDTYLRRIIQNDREGYRTNRKNLLAQIKVKNDSLLELKDTVETINLPPEVAKQLLSIINRGLKSSNTGE